MEEGYFSENERLKEDWKDRYIDLIQLLADEKGMVPVFTPDCKFISQDTRHLTQPGAVYIGGLVEKKISEILE